MSPERFQPSKKVPSKEVPLQNTLFDEAMIIGMTDDAISLDEVRRQLGIKAPEIITPKPPVDGAFVKLGARALAIDQLMDSINYRNMKDGAHKTSETGGSDFNNRQSSPDATLSGMRFNDSQNKKADQESIDILNASTAMIAAGFSPEEVQWSRNRLIDTIKEYEGVGRKNVARRKKLGQTIQAVAIRQQKSIQ